MRSNRMASSGDCSTFSKVSIQSLDIANILVHSLFQNFWSGTHILGPHRKQTWDGTHQSLASRLKREKKKKKNSTDCFRIAGQAHTFSKISAVVHLLSKGTTGSTFQNLCLHHFRALPAPVGVRLGLD